MSSPHETVIFPFIVRQAFGIDGIFGMRVSIQIMSSESFQQEIMTQNSGDQGRILEMRTFK